MSNYNGMPMPMGPPMIPGYSLRVQLFAPNSHSVQDTPIRCFRVVTSPDATLEEFCREASRIHAINYGEPISIKKCQDDQMFDVTQSDLLGPIFANAATIRMIKASSVPNIRDSVPPTSALRYNPSQLAGKKRIRSPSVELNGTGTPPARKNGKRRRIAELNPDHPLPSLEEDAEINESENESRTDLIIPDSQPTASIQQDGMENTQLVRRLAVPVISSASPEQRILTSTDDTPKKTTTARRHSGSIIRQKPSLANPYDETTRPQSSSTHSMSYHIPRIEERGTSVSTAATTPLSADPQLDFPGSTVASAVAAAFKPQVSNPRAAVQNGFRSPNEELLYDNVPSDNEGPAILRKTRAAALKAKKSPGAGLPGLSNTNGLDTPSSENRRRSKDLPITPNSQARKISDDSSASESSHKRARNAAAEAAEKRLAEERARIAEARKMTEEKSKAEAEKKAAEEARQDELKAERKAAEAKRLEELAARKRETEEIRLKARADKRLEERRKQEEAEAAEKKLAEEKKAEEERQQSEKSRIELKAKLDEELGTGQERPASQRRSNERQEVEKKKWDAALSNGDLTLKNLRERSASLSEKRSASPQLTRTQQSPMSKSPTPLFKTPIRPQSSTPHIPRGRKPAMKSSSVTSSSPELAKKSPEAERKGVGIEDQMPLPPPHKRRVSFALDEEKDKSSGVAPRTNLSPAVLDTKPASQKAATPVRSSQASAILPPKTLNSRTATPVRPPPKVVAAAKKSLLGEDSARKSTTPVPGPPGLRSKTPLKAEPKHSTTPVLPPAPLFRTRSMASSQERSATPTRGKTVPSSSIVKKSPVVEIPARIVSKSPALGAPKEEAHLKESPRATQPTPRKIETVEISSDEDQMSSDEESNEMPRDTVATSSAQISSAARSSIVRADEDIDMTDAKDVMDDESTQSQDEEDVDMESVHSSPRQSHSPISFNPNTSTQNSSFKATNAEAYQVPLPEATVSEDEAFQEKSSQSEEEEKERGETSSEGESASEDDDMEEERTIPSVQMASSTSPQKTQRRYPTCPSSPSSLSTQAEVDQQLTSSFPEAIRSSPPVTTSVKTSVSHIMKNGASLKSLHSNRRSLVNTSSQVSKPTLNGSRYAMKTLQQQADDESSEEDESSSDSDSDSSDALPAPISTQKKARPASESDSELSDDEDQKSSKAMNAATKKKQTVNGGDSRKAGKDMKGKKDYTRNAAFNFRGF